MIKAKILDIEFEFDDWKHESYNDKDRYTFEGFGFKIYKTNDLVRYNLCFKLDNYYYDDFRIWITSNHSDIEKHIYALYINLYDPDKLVFDIDYAKKEVENLLNNYKIIKVFI